MQKVLIISGTTDILTNPSLNEETFKNVADTTIKSKLDYANQNRYDFLYLNDFGVDIKNRYNSTQIGYLRILKVFDTIENYDYVVWIDADALITNKNLRIEDFPIDDCVFCCSYDWNGYYSLNTGNFILKNTERTKIFIDQFYNVSKNYNMPEEQATINKLFSLPETKNNIKVLDHGFLNAVPSVDIVNKKIWGNKPVPPNPWKFGNFLVHATGLPNSERIRIFKEHFKDYL